MSFNNSITRNQNSDNFKGSWGSFYSKYETLNNYKNPDNPAMSSLTPNTNFENRSAPQYEASKILEFGKRMDLMLQNQNNCVSNSEGFGGDSNVKGDRMDSFGANRQSQSNYDDSNGKNIGNRMDSFGANIQFQSNSNVTGSGYPMGSFGSNQQPQSNYDDSNVTGSGYRMGSIGAKRQPQSNYDDSNGKGLGNRMDSFGANQQYPSNNADYNARGFGNHVNSFEGHRQSQSNYNDSNVKGSGDPSNSANRQAQSNYKPYANNFENNMDSFRGNQRSQSNFGNSNLKNTNFGTNTFKSNNEPSARNPLQNSLESFRPNRSNDFNNKSDQSFSSFNFGAQRNQYNSNNFGNKDQAGSWQPGSLNNKNSKFSNKNQSNTYNSNSNNNKGNADSNYVPFRKFRQFYTNRQHQDPATASDDKRAAPSLFMGRDPSYPDELNNLMNPFFCALCKSRLNSIKTSNVHYVSKPHDKQITKWFKANFEDKGLDVPQIKRFVSEEKTGCYPCHLCNLDLTSPQHALQHYNGKRHRMAASKISQPTGIGYYNVEGKWIETGKIIDKSTGKEATYIMVDTPTGSEPVVLYVAPTTSLNLKKPANPESTQSEEPPAKKPNISIAPNKPATTITTPKIMAPDSTTNNQNYNRQSSLNQLQLPQDALNTKQCKICGINTTSYDQMILHLKGKAHSKKLKALGEPPLSDIFGKSPSTSNTILDSIQAFDPLDISMFRTPSGKYYCQTCDVRIPSEDLIKKHIESNAHLEAIRKKA